MRELAPFSLDDLATASFHWERSAVIRATPEAVFAELGDPSLWFPLMHRSVWMTGATSGVGAVREVELRALGRFRELFLAWDPPGSDGHGRIAFTMTAVDSPIPARMAEELTVAPHAEGVVFTYGVYVDPSRVGKVLLPPMRLVLRGLFAGAVRGVTKRTAWSAGRVRATHGA